MWIVCADLEGVFVPEIWVNVALKTGIEELKLTTRDIKDYDVLMKYRLEILDKHNLKLQDIQEVINTLQPLPGALEFIREIRKATRFAIVSDTFVEFAQPLMDKLENPFLLCHNLETDASGRIVNYRLRQEDPKRKTVEAFKSLNYNVLAFGDSYNDVTMISRADKGILFCPPENVKADFPQYPVVTDLESLKKEILETVKN
ncbi:MAG: bifunctional phosphoserine phosphatase/homoserine phosphotransferase ThrH [Alphaproteobacteria bacterium]|jgi:phosphoserine/homoserine phosphotransferase|nr:bifunctional phosphoserine phosphatase/homoserine phosphotransferase ThrH [Bacteroidales bacterium]MBQ5403103.1 bifunctional phosphoserine phosphatase/homoserine phosphotransferase ThrH [Bacteroidales bacterium]